MLGILLYFVFLFLGYGYSCHFFRERDLYFRVWMGGIFGNVLLMAGIVLPACFLNFTYLSHGILLILSALPLLYLWKKQGFQTLSGTLFAPGENTSGIDSKVFGFLLLPLMVLISLLMTNHILAPFDGGGVASGQCTYGDLQMHLGFVTSIAEQKIFPPNYAFLDGYTLNYPFFVNMLSSSLYLFGTPLRWAVLIPSYVLAALLVMGFYILAYRLTQKKSSSILAVILFFLGSGFGFAYFLNGAKADNAVFTEIFNGYYHTPTNLPDYNLRWVNPICDMIIPQRTTMAGWCMFFPALWLLLEGLQTKSSKHFTILGVLAGCMPMIHTHTFLALGMISGVLLFAYLVGEKDKKSYLIRWAIYGGIVLLLAAPQLFYWTFRQSVNNDAFLRFSFNWVNHKDTYFWFYLKNWGIIALLALPGILHASKDNKKLMLGCGFIFVIAELILFQPNEYDNNKLFFIPYMVLVMLVSDWLVAVYHALKGVKGRQYLAIILVIAGTFSGVLTLIREYKSGADYMTFSKDDLAMAEYIKENTPSDAVFLTGTYHINPVVSLAGRNIYVGSSLYVYFHGMDDTYFQRNEEIKNAYKSGFHALRSFCQERGIDYIYVSENETKEYAPQASTLQWFEKVYTAGSKTLYKVD